MGQKGSKKIGGFIIGIPIFIITFFYSFSLIDPVLLPKFLGWGFFMVALAISTLFKRNGHISWTFQSNPIIWALAAYLVLSALSLIQTRNLPDGVFEWYKSFFLFFFVILLIIRFQHQKALLINGITLAAAFLAYVGAVFGFFQFLDIIQGSGLSHSEMYGISGTFAHRNLYAEILFLTLPFNIYGFLQLRKGYQWFCLGAAFVGLFIIIILMSRAVWLAVLTGMVAPILVYIYVAFMTGNLSSTIKNQIGKIIKAIGAIVLIAALSVFVYTRFDTATAFKKQVVSIFQFNFTYGSIKDRIDLWSKSWEIIKDRPVTGVGLGDWEQALLAKGNKGMLSEDNKTFFQRPHNDFLWVCSESGIFAMLCYIGIFGGAVYMLLSSIWKEPRGPNTLFNYFLLFALTGYITYALFSFPKERIAHQVLLGFILTLTYLHTHPKANPPKSKPGSIFLGLGLGLLIVGLGLFLGIKRMEAEAATSKALKARMDQNPQKVIRYIYEAENPYYQIDPMSTPLRWYSGSAHHKLGQHRQALRDFHKAYQLNPYHMHVVNNLGTLYQIHGKSDSAIKYYNKALDLSPHFTTAALNLAAVHFNRGEIDKAIKTMRTIPYQEDQKKYKTYLGSILEAKVKKIKTDISNEQVIAVIDGILTDKDWLTNIYKKSLDKKSFKHQLLKDVIYVLEKEEKSISFDEAKRLKQKYLQHG